MTRFVLGMIPPAVMGLSFWAYGEAVKHSSASAGLVRHTLEARSLADRLARDAGCEPDLASLARTLERFAVTTGDNPVQVRAAAAIRDALARGDLGAVGPLADAAAEEETRLMEERTAAARADFERTRGAIGAAFGLAFAMSAALGLTAMASRTLRALGVRDGGGD